MKRIIALFMVAAMVLTFSACGEKTKDAQGEPGGAEGFGGNLNIRKSVV